ncbi:uncharacterized protein LOC126819646 [Patella vulgata]|uniref:uncharacterized protein LOC126819646 n=1 Tax=Patella vulgata TaxID=6465 RepID=UPI00217F8AA5|nr:uncharacterized protein LOC126819646 [Patella vulgata]
MSPSLFSIYINDLVEVINAANCGVTVDNRTISIMLYADDIVLITPDETSMDKLLSVLNEWCEKWQISLNPQKTKIVHFRTPSKPQSTHKFTCGPEIIETCDCYRYFGLWFNERLDMNKTVKELSKSASRALGVLCIKFKILGGMTFKVFSKLYASLVEPILFYCAGIWGTKSYSCVNNIQNKAIKFFLGVGKTTSNLATRGDVGWTSCETKQKVECIRQLCKLHRLDSNRYLSSYFNYLMIHKTRNSWYTKVTKFVESINLGELIKFNINSVKYAVNEAKLRFDELDSLNWSNDMYNDKNNVNGNKLRTYRQFKHIRITESYVTNPKITRHQRRLISQTRSGSLPIAIETGRYSKPPILLENRLCNYCDQKEIENEFHVIMKCKAYNDIRREILADFVNNTSPNYDEYSYELFLMIMSDDYAQTSLGKFLEQMYYKRKQLSV